MTPEKDDPGKSPEKENKGPVGCNEGQACASGHCCWRRSTGRLLVSKYFGDN